MQTSITKQEVDEAVKTGLKMLSAENINTPNAWNIDLGNLQRVLVLILSGQLVLKQPEQDEQPPEEKVDLPKLIPEGKKN